MMSEKKREKILVMGVGNTCGVPNNYRDVVKTKERLRKHLKKTKKKKKRRKRGADLDDEAVIDFLVGEMVLGDVARLAQQTQSQRGRRRRRKGGGGRTVTLKKGKEYKVK